MGLYKYIVEQGQGFDDQAGRDTAIDKYYVTGVLDATAWVNATHTEPGEPTNAVLVGSEVDESDPPIVVSAGNFTVSDGTNQITVSLSGNEDSVDEVLAAIDSDNRAAPTPLNINFQSITRYNDYTGVTTRQLKFTSTGDPGQSDEITVAEGTATLSQFGLSATTVYGTQPDVTIKDILCLGGNYTTSNGMIDNPDIPKITSLEYIDGLSGVEQFIKVIQKGQVQDEITALQIEDFTTTWQDTEFDDAVDTPISTFQDGTGAYLYEQGRVDTEFNATKDDILILSAAKATGTLDSVIDIVAKGGPLGNLTINIENGGVGFRDNETATVVGSTMTVLIEDGESRLQHIATVIQNHPLIESATIVNEEDQWTRWSLGSGTDTVTLTGGGDNYTGTSQLPFEEPDGTVSDENDATVLIYDDSTLIAYADENGDLQDMGSYLDGGGTNAINYSSGVVDLDVASISQPVVTVNSSVMTGESSAYTYEPVTTDTNDKTRQASDLQKHIALVITDSKEFGEDLINEFTKENVLMGITQSGQTNAVRKALQETWLAIQTGSLHDAIYEAEQVTRTSPFLTEARLRNFINEIEAYLGEPLST